MRLLFLINLIFFCSYTNCQTTLQNGFVYYHTPYEQVVFEKQNPTNLEMFMCIGKNATEQKTIVAEEKIKNFIEEIKKSNILRLSEVKQIKELHKRVHQNFLSNYKSDAQFYEIFETGLFNCVSSTALFGIILEELEIPFYIQEQPSHVFIMAYPATKSISVEMTASSDAYWLPNKNDIHKSIRILLEYGLITQYELDHLGETGIYNKYYNINRPLTMIQLAGIQYMNQSFFASKSENYQEALNSVCKAEQWFIDDKVKLAKAEYLFKLINDKEITNLNDVRNLMIYASLPKADNNRVRYEYITFLDNQLSKKGNKELVDSSYQILNTSKIDNELKNNLIGYYFAFFSDYYESTYNTTKQLKCAEEAYSYLPDDIHIQRLLISAFIKSNFNDDTEEELEKITAFKAKYPKLANHNLINTVLVVSYAQIATMAFEDDEGEEGDLYMSKTMELYNKLEDKSSIDINLIGWIYAEKGTFLYREKRFTEAIKVLEEGLIIAPNHERILVRMELIKNRMKK